MDRQSLAFRDAQPIDWASAVELAPVPDDVPIRSVDEWEADGWDAGRLPPKTLPEARAALAARVADPSAPDEDAAAYDDLGPGYSPGGVVARSAGRPYAAGSVRALWLADACRSSGLPVVLVPGWEGRGHGGFRAIEGVVGHHTATPERAAGDYPSRNVVTNGRAGLKGPLCNVGLGRSGTAIVVAAGVAYHAGATNHLGFTDLNDEFVGIEAEDSGDGQWNAAMRDAYPRLVAALLRYMRRGVERYVSHRDSARPRGRKPDPAGLTDKWMRDSAHRLLVGGGPIPTPVRPTPAPPVGSVMHTVVAGDTLYSLARRYGVTVANLRGWNSLGSDTLSIGQTLRVAAAPGPAPAPAPTGRRILRYDPPNPIMEGDDVEDVQRVLRAWYSLPASFVDRQYGPETVKYVKRAQTGTPPQPRLTADGEVGDDTRRKLNLPT